MLTSSFSTRFPQSLILAAVKQEKYARLIDVAVKYAKEQGGDKQQQISNATDRLLVEFGSEILKIIPGRVSTEVDARLSFDKEATVAKAKHLIALYESVGIKRERILIKIASTWEGIQAARELERDHNIHCNLTLLFGFAQAVACAEANVTLISPFVGRILDFYKAQGNTYEPHEDPGVLSVKRIYSYYKTHGYKTIVMGASFRSTAEALELAGCDYLTISPKLLEEMKNTPGPVERKLSPDNVKAEEKVSFIDNQSAFLLALATDPMANTKLAEGIAGFAKDGATLEGLLADKL